MEFNITVQHTGTFHSRAGGGEIIIKTNIFISYLGSSTCYPLKFLHFTFVGSESLDTA